MKQSLSRIQAVVVLVAAGSFVGLAFNLAAPKGVLSLTARTATAEAAAPAPDPAPAPTAASATTQEPASPAAAPREAKKPVRKSAAKAAPAKATSAKATSPKAAPAKATSAKATSASPAAAPAGAKPVPATAAPPAAPEKPAAPQVVELPEARLLQLQKSAILLDARERNVYELGHIPGALSLPDPEFATAFARLEARLPRDAKILVYCESETCDQAETVSWNLVHKGYKNILLFKKGWSAWEAADYPQEKGPSR
ncbi:MAG: rhodanese-like domain-containing protein [Candidatus Eisenbacteria bacterium]|nr:rhodanese-like domain-containing protein [Candidatus Eisenbacteria bacterium]